MSIQARETIAALATPPGEGGIAVIRVSGRDAIEIVATIFRGADLRSKPSHTAHFGRIHRNGEIVDEVLATVFRSPKSYTGEDAVEISCHGGVLVTQSVLETVLAAGARAAEPGEFTQRAFLNGKMELSQAEAVADLIHAKSRRALQAAQQQLDGALGRFVSQFRQAIIDAKAMVELELDFIEEDVEFANRDQLRALLTDLDQQIARLLETYETGRLLRDGVKTVLVGKPNAGKSTLLNTLTGKDRAIVSAIAGTTRDTIDADWTYEGVYFRLVDTAGLRETADVIEAEGVKRSQRAIADADVVMLLTDLTAEGDAAAEAADLRHRFPGKPLIHIGNKADLALEQRTEGGSDRQKHETSKKAPPGHEASPNTPTHGIAVGGEAPAGHAPSPNTPTPTHGNAVGESVGEVSTPYDVLISASTGQGVDRLKKLLKEKAMGRSHADARSLVITATRHRDALAKTRDYVRAAIDRLDEGASNEFLALDLRGALQELASITGQISNEDVLDSIFSRFCIGK